MNGDLQSVWTYGSDRSPQVISADSTSLLWALLKTSETALGETPKNSASSLVPTLFGTS